MSINECSQVFKSWLQDVTHKLNLLSALPLKPKLVAAAVLMCCARHVLHEPVNDKTNVFLLQMLALQSNGEGFNFLGSFMKENDSQ